MSVFEQAYYENGSFWDGMMVRDPLNLRRIQITADMIPEDVQSLLDVGCGNGIFLDYLVKNKPHITDLRGTDRSEAALQYVKVPSFLASIDHLPVKEETFDCVTCLEVLEHLPVNVFKTALDELARISKKYIIVSVPFKEAIEQNSTQCPKCKSIFNINMHLRSFDENHIQNLLVHRGFKCINMVNAVKHKKYLGSKIIDRIKARGVFFTPICPLCGYENLNYTKSTANPLNNINGKESWIKSIIKKMWPKTSTRGYWVIALYRLDERQSSKVV